MRTIRPLTTLSVAVIAALFFNTHLFAQNATKSNTTVHDGSMVSFDYTLSDENGNVVDSNKGKEPMSYTHGKGQIIPGLEKELSGMKVGEQKKVLVKPDDGYGPVNPQAFQEVPKDKLPPDALKIGTMLMAHGPEGQNIPARVHEIKADTVIMDFNHPLAGKTLYFDIKIADIKPADK